MPKNIGYLLPAGDAYTDDFVCAIVAVPNKPEYFNALRGTLDYLGMWLAWERDEDKRGKDAARAWLEANEITQECWAMATCEQILALLISIDSKLGNIGCCDGSTTVGDIVTVVTVIEPGVGDPPTHWGETAVADWDEWLEYVCYHAHKFVDSLVETAGTLDTIMELGAYTVQFFANILRTLRFLTLVYPVSYDSALQIFQSFKDAGDASDLFDDAAADFEAAREDIVCAFINGLSVSDAVEDALTNHDLWTYLYQFNDFDSTQALVYEGTADDVEYLEPVKRDDCSCVTEEQQLIPNSQFNADLSQWIMHTSIIWEATRSGRDGICRDPRASQGTGYGDIVSGDFVVPSGVTKLRFETGYLRPTGVTTFTFSQRLYLASDDSVIATKSQTIGTTGWSDWESSTMDVEAGETYYVSISMDYGGTPKPGNIDYIGCWTDID